VADGVTVAKLPPPEVAPPPGIVVETPPQTTPRPPQPPVTKPAIGAAASLPTEAAAAAVEGGATARTEDPADDGQSGSAKARAGVSRAYAKGVVDALAVTKPKSLPGMRGTVKIVFTIAVGGTVEAAYVGVSSGHAPTDQAALDAVRQTRFPAPPAAFTSKDRLFEMPYFFR
jgi:periplasmic protein TonB